MDHPAFNHCHIDEYPIVYIFSDYKQPHDGFWSKYCYPHFTLSSVSTVAELGFRWRPVYLKDYIVTFFSLLCLLIIAIERLWCWMRWALQDTRNLAADGTSGRVIWGSDI